METDAPKTRFEIEAENLDKAVKDLRAAILGTKEAQILRRFLEWVLDGITFALYQFPSSKR